MATPPSTLVVLDIETTGLTKGHHEIIEVCALVCRLEPGLPVESKVCTRIQAQHPERASGQALEVNGRSRESLSEGMELGAALRLLRTVLEGAVVAGHNVAVFDLPFLEEAFGDRPWDYHVIDTASISTMDWLLCGAKSASFRTLCKEAGVWNEAPHTAFGDADACRRVLAQLFADAPGEIRSEAP